MKTFLSGRLCISLLLAALAAGCSEGEKRPSDPPSHPDSARTYHDTIFQAPAFGEGRRLDTVMAVDMNGTGRSEYIVTSIAPDSITPAGGRADLLQIFSHDPENRRYTLALADTLGWVSGLELRDVTGDGLPELIVHTYSGGNDMVASNGLTIYSGTGGSLRKIFDRPDGDPELAKLEHARGEGVLVHDELWPEFASHAEASEYLSDILAFRDGAYVSVRKEQRNRFAALADGYLQQYNASRDRFVADTVAVTGAPETATPASIDQLHPLFTPAALAMLSFGGGSDLRSLRSFWSSEREYLMRRLPPAQFAELDAIYARMIAM